MTVTLRRCYSLMAFTKSLKDPYVKSGSGSSLKNILRAPVVTWMSSHLLSFRSTFSSDGTDRQRDRGQVSQVTYHMTYSRAAVQSRDRTVIDGKAELLDHRQVPAHSVQAVDAET